MKIDSTYKICVVYNTNTHPDQQILSNVIYRDLKKIKLLIISVKKKKIERKRKIK